MANQMCAPTPRGPAPAGNITQYLFKTAHEVVADRGSRQISSAGASPHIEEIIRAQHGVVFLGVTRGGQYPVHRYRHLAKSQGKGESRAMTP